MHHIYLLGTVYMYSISLCLLQPESQKGISHSELTASYPRYPDVFDAMRDYTPEERFKLMVC